MPEKAVVFSPRATELTARIDELPEAAFALIEGFVTGFEQMAAFVESREEAAHG